jgi:hypothetical protein
MFLMLRELFEIDFFISMTEIYILLVFRSLLMAGQMAG